MRKLILWISTVIIAICCFVPAFAEESTTLPEITAATALSKEESEQIDAEIETVSEPETTTSQTLPTTEVETDNTESLIVKGHGFVSFGLSGSDVPVTIVISNGKNDYTLEFKEETLYVVQGSYPVGEYTIKSVESESNNYKIKELTVNDSKDGKFTVKETDFMSVSMTAKVKRIPYIVGFLKREWFLLVALVILSIMYFYRRKHRILPSQEI